MSRRSARSNTKPTGHFKHGLTARPEAQGWFDEAAELAEDLIDGAPRTAEILSTAVELAQTIFLLQAICAERQKILSTPVPPRDFEEFAALEDYEEFRQEVIHSKFLENPPKEPWAEKLIELVRFPEVAAAYVPSAESVPRLLRLKRRELRRVEDYERKALSRRRRLVNRLDYLISEERRRNIEA